MVFDLCLYLFYDDQHCMLYNIINWTFKNYYIISYFNVLVVLRHWVIQFIRYYKNNLEHLGHFKYKIFLGSKCMGRNDHLTAGKKEVSSKGWGPLS